MSEGEDTVFTINKILELKIEEDEVVEAEKIKFPEITFRSLSRPNTNTTSKSY
jgi:hypothetical protein